MNQQLSELQYKQIQLQIEQLQKQTNMSSIPTYNDIDSWLATRKLLTDISEQYINDNHTFVENIIALTVGNYKQLIYHLINTVNLKQRNVIQNILKQEKEKYDQNDNMHQQNILTPTSYFDQLSTTSITNICGYLNTDDISQFKLTCNSIAVQCFLEMKKYANVGVLDLSKLHTQYKYLSLFQSINRPPENVFTFVRYNKSIMQDPYSYLQSWSNTYNIPQHRLLLSRTNYNYSAQAYYIYHQAWSNWKFSIIYDTDEFRSHVKCLVLIFDKQKINDISLQLSMENDTNENQQFPPQPSLQPSISIEAISNTSHNYRPRLVDAPEFIPNPYVTTANSSPVGSVRSICSEPVVLLLYYFDIEKQFVEYNQTLIVNSDATKTQLLLFIKHNLNIFVPQISTNDMNLTQKLQKGIEVFAQNKKVFSDGDILYNVVVFAATDKEYIEQCKNNWELQLESNAIFYDNPWDLSKDIIHKLQIKKQFVNKNKTESKLFMILRPQILYNIFSFLSWNNIRIFSLLSVSFAIITAKHWREGFEERKRLIGEGKRLIGEKLWQKVQAIEPNLALKITEMLLELDSSELQELLEDNDQLMRRIKEGKDALTNVMQKGSAKGSCHAESVTPDFGQ